MTNLSQVIKVIFLALLITFITSLATSVEARVTPEDIINAKKAEYQQKFNNYSPTNQQRLNDMEQQISTLNQDYSRYLDQLMDVQARILDEHERRNPQQSTSSQVEKARYWITFAHEAVAYQAAKVYVFNLSSEKNVKSDVSNTLSILQADLNATRAKVINSQNILESVIK